MVLTRFIVDLHDWLYIGSVIQLGADETFIELESSSLRLHPKRGWNRYLRTFSELIHLAFNNFMCGIQESL